MIVDMHKIQLAVTKNQTEQFMTWLQEEGVLHVTHTNEENEENRVTGNGFDKEMAYIQFALEFISHIRGELNIKPDKSWRNFFAGKPTASLARLEQTIEGLSLDKVNEEIREISDKLGDLKNRQQEINDLLGRLNPWQNLSVTGEQLNTLARSRHYLLKIGTQDEIAIKKIITDTKTSISREVSRQTTKKKGKIYLEVAVHKTEAENLKKLIDNTSAETVSLPVPEKETVPNYIKSLKKEKQELHKQQDKLLKKGKSFLKMEDRLKFAYDGILHRQERNLAGRKSLHLQRTTIVTGWLPKHHYPEFTQKLEKEFPSAAIDIDKNNRETPPVAIKNSKILEPFETVTNIYGRPKHTELDPTGPLSIFFLVSFGLALTDAGYGIMMMLTMWLTEKYFRLKTETKKMIRLLYYTGFSTAVFGALTGGWFGIDITNLPAGEIKSALLSLKVIDPIQEPMPLLLVSFAVGIVQLLFAWIVRAYDHARNKDYVAVVLDDIAWFILVTVLLLWMASRQGMFLTAYTRPLQIAVLIMAAIAVLGGGRSYKNPFLKLGGGILSLYGLVNFMSDTLSYSRLLALGLATGIIALVVNMIGVMIASSIPGVGWLIAAVVLVGGHLFNLGINALGAFIHSGRLQYVEFFPKFLEGGGDPYRPFGRVTKYVDNPKDFV